MARELVLCVVHEFFAASVSWLVCADCGTRFTDERRKAIEPAGWDAPADERQLRALAGEALGEMYLRDGGRRAAGLHVEFTDVEQAEFDL